MARIFRTNTVQNNLDGRDAAASFYKVLLQTVQKKYWLVVVILFLSCSIAALDSFFFKSFCSEAVILIPAHEDSSRLETRSLDIQTNERFLSTQRTALTSEKILRDALITLHPDQEVTQAAIESLQSGLSVMRMPFNNSIVLRLERSDPRDIQPLLNAIIDSYEDWFRSGITREAIRLRQSLEQELENHSTRLTTAEEALNSFDKKNRTSFLAEQFVAKNDALDYGTVQLQESQRRLSRLKAMIDVATVDGLGPRTTEAVNKCFQIHHEGYVEAILDHHIVRRSTTSELQEVDFVNMPSQEQRHLRDNLRDAVVLCVRHSHIRVGRQTKPRLHMWIERRINILDHHTYATYLEQRNQQLRDDLQKLTYLKEARRILQRNVELATQAVSQLSEKQRNVDWFISRNNLLSIEILSSPSAPKLMNPLWRSAAYSIASGVCASFLVLYLLSLRTYYLAHRAHLIGT